MKFFWFRHGNNYGDILTPFICQKLDKPCVWAKRQFAEAIMVGSIANQSRPGVKVCGSGFIRRNDVVCKTADYIWLRGPISRNMVIKAGGVAPEIYGDAALLLPEMIKASPKIHDIGYVPHHVDYHAIKSGFRVNLVKGGVEHITKEITKCRKVISSSLHGIIVAHAYGIPAAWVKLSNKLTGDDMKFYDHYESVGLEAQLSTLDNPIFQLPSEIKTADIRRLICSL